MAREKELFRFYLERLDATFPGKELLTVSDVCRFCGIGDETAKKFYSFEKKRITGRKNTYYISKGKLASELS